MFNKNKNKTKWVPLYCYGDYYQRYNMVFTRLDKETGLLDFTTKEVGANTLGLEIYIDTQSVLDNLLKEE